MNVNGYIIEAFANLNVADLHVANLRGADLRGADLRGANLHGANLCGANLCGANLHGANLYGANLCGANLRGANLCGAKNIPKMPWTIIVPEGDLIVYKKTTNQVIKLLIPKEAKRSNGTSRKCRAEYAIVLECVGKTFSKHNSSYFYEKGMTVRPTKPFDEDRWNECASGIHFFLTREEAEEY